jgi:hypothetical protein
VLFWAIAPCRLLVIYHGFGDLHLQDTNMLHPLSGFKPVDGGSMFLRNFGIEGNTVQKPRIPQSECKFVFGIIL